MSAVPSEAGKASRRIAMSPESRSVTSAASAPLQGNFPDTPTTKQQRSVAFFAHELELIQESYQFGLATRHEVREAEGQLIAAWRNLISLSAADSDFEAHMIGGSNGKRH